MKKTISYDALWFGMTSLIILTLAFILPLVGNDYWWYVRLGDIIWHTHQIPAVDTFSYTQSGQPIFYQSWLSSLIFYSIQKSLGVDGIFLLRGLLLWITYGILWIMCRKSGSGPRISTALVLTAALAGSGNWAHRPQLLVYPLFVLTLYLLWDNDLPPRRLVWLPVIALIWVNLHGSFPLFFALTGIAWLTRPAWRRPLGWTLTVSLIATLANPHGWRAWQYVFHMLSDPSSQRFSMEWHPPVNDGWQMGLFFFWLLALPLLTHFSTQRWHLRQWLWYLGFGWLALSGVRYVIWLLFLLAPLSARLLADWRSRLDAWPAEIHPPFNWTVTAALLLLPGMFLPGLRTAFIPAEILPVYANVPETAVRFLAEQELPGHLWADLDYNAYLIYALPQKPVWIDTRFELYPPEQWLRYRQIAEARFGWDAALAQDNIQTLLLAPQREPDLIRAVEASPGWTQIYQDPQAVIYVKTH